MSQCVPSWGLDDNSNPPKPSTIHTHSNSTNSLSQNVPSLDYEVAELTWENGQLAMHGFGPSRVANKPAATWDKPLAGGTLESIVNQATRHPQYPNGELVPWFDHGPAVNPAATTSVTMTMDALVPCGNNNVHENPHDNRENSTRVGSCSGVPTGGGVRGGSRAAVARAGVLCSCKTANASVSESATCGGGMDSRQLTLDTCEREFGGGAGFTSTSMWSPGNTSSGKECSRTSAEEHDSVCHSRPQRDKGDDQSKRKLGLGKSSVSTKKSRAAAIHNQSERKRRDKINQRMKTLQKLVPNSSKTDKASMLDEVIEYLKQLQAQVNMMSRMNMPSMMLPLAMQQQQQQLQMSAMMGMGMPGGVMPDINTISRAMPPVMPPAAFMPMWDIQGDGRMHSSPAPVMPDLLSAFIACQSQPTAIDAYSRLAALYQQFQQPPASGSKN